MATTTTTSTKDSCVCIFASALPLNPMVPQTDALSINIAALDVHIPYHPYTKKPLEKITNWAKQKGAIDTRTNFCSMSESQQRKFILNIIQNLNIPFPLENIHWSNIPFLFENINWSLHFPPDQETGMSMDQAMSRVLDIARTSAGQQEKGRIRVQIQIHKLEKVPFEATCMEDWLEENQNDVRNRWMGIGRSSLFYMKAIREDFFGLKPVMMKEAACPCPICLRNMQEGKLAVQMPCSHIFHGFCLFDWFTRKPTCPLCRHDMFGPDDFQKYVADAKYLNSRLDLW